MNRQLVYGLILIGGALAVGFTLLRTFSDDAKERAADLPAPVMPTTDGLPPTPTAATRLVVAPQERTEIQQTLRAPDKPIAERAKSAEDLGRALDWESIPVLLEAMNDPSEQVRGRAGWAAQRIIGAEYTLWSASAPEAQRKGVIQEIRRYWDARRNNPPDFTRSNP